MNLNLTMANRLAYARALENIENAYATGNLNRFNGSPYVLHECSMCIRSITNSAEHFALTISTDVKDFFAKCGFTTKDNNITYWIGF